MLDTPLTLYQILLGGGQEAMNVTTTSARQGKFETRFWHKILEEEVGRVKGHFGPINTYVVPSLFLSNEGRLIAIQDCGTSGWYWVCVGCRRWFHPCTPFRRFVLPSKAVW